MGGITKSFFAASLRFLMKEGLILVFEWGFLIDVSGSGEKIKKFDSYRKAHQ